MGFWSWLTGRNPKESDVYANYGKVEEVTNEIKTIATKGVGDAQEAIYASFNALNSLTGMQEYIGAISVNNYDSFFDSISTTISGIADSMETKAEAIKDYEETPWYTKVGSSITMGVCKIGEGLLSVVEDLGDGFVSLVGWGAGIFGAKDFQEDCANFIKKEWSHDAFNFYYNSDFAKASAFTEDSAIAGAFKFVGQVGGYIAAGYVAAGAMGLSAGATIGSGLLSVSGTTLGGAAVAGIAGLGTGTEAGLNLGMDYNDAFKKGVGRGALSAGFALGVGKTVEMAAGGISNKLAQRAANKTVKAIKNILEAEGNSADDQISAITQKVLGEGAQGLDDLTTNAIKKVLGGAAQGSDEAASAIKSLVEAGAQGLDDTTSGAINSILQSTSQTADDQAMAIMRLAQGAAQGSDETATAIRAALEATGQSADDQANAIVKALTSGAQSADDGVSAAGAALSKLKSAPGKIASGIKSAPGKIVGGIKSIPGGIVNGIKSAPGAIAANGLPTLTAGGVGAAVGATLADKSLKTEISYINDQIEDYSRYKDLAAGITDLQEKGSFTPADTSKLSGLGLSTTPELETIVPSEPKSGAEDYINGVGQTYETSPPISSGGSRSVSYMDTNPIPGVSTSSTQTGGTSSTQTGGTSSTTTPTSTMPTTAAQTITTPTSTMPTTAAQTIAEMPTVAVPTTAVPTTTVSTIATPTTVAPTTATRTIAEMPTVAVPTTTVSTIATPTTAARTISEMPTVAVPTTTVSTITASEIGSVTPIVTAGAKSGSGTSGGSSGVGYTSIGSSTKSGGGSDSGSIFEEPGVVDDSTHSGTAFDETDLQDDSLTTSLGSLFDDTNSSIDEIIKGSKYTRTPTDQTPIEARKSGGGSSSVIPIAAGLSVASAAGLGAKAYMDHKHNNEMDSEDEFGEEYEDDDDFIADGWTEDADQEAIENEEDNDQVFINQDKQDEDEYYHASESPVPIMGAEELNDYL